MTNTSDFGRGTILYDGDCPMCSAGAKTCGAMLRRKEFSLRPLQGAKIDGLTKQDLLREVHLVTPAGEVLRGVDVLLHVAETIPWARPLRLVRYVPGGTNLARAAYRFIARYRYELSELPRWIPPVALMLATLQLLPGLPPWGRMWLLTLAVFVASKWMTCWPHRHLGSMRRRLAYFFAWTGMDARAFLADDRATAPPPRAWIEPIIKTGIGVILLAIAHALPARVAAWCGMLGLILILHFGLFQQLALAWQRKGVNARPLMNCPLRSRSTGELWGRRWNSGFNALAEQTIFTPLARRHGVTTATIAVFAASGLIHDLLISVPARGGYGLPTAYFLIQLAGLLIERTRLARRIGFGRGAIGWLFTAAVALLPLPLLFHPPFIENVMLPFLHAIGVMS